jgi:hypothetical protein
MFEAEHQLLEEFFSSTLRDREPLGKRLLNSGGTSLLVGIMHQTHRPLGIVGRTPRALAEALIARVR